MTTINANDDADDGDGDNDDDDDEWMIPNTIYLGA